MLKNFIIESCLIFFHQFYCCTFCYVYRSELLGHLHGKALSLSAWQNCHLFKTHLTSHTLQPLPRNLNFVFENGPVCVEMVLSSACKGILGQRGNHPPCTHQHHYPHPPTSPFSWMHSFPHGVPASTRRSLQSPLPGSQSHWFVKIMNQALHVNCQHPLPTSHFYLEIECLQLWVIWTLSL